MSVARMAMQHAVNANLPANKAASPVAPAARIDSAVLLPLLTRCLT
jgi:hypothetical protein